MTEWHADTASLTRWVDGGAGAAEATSVEQHLLGCVACRAQVDGQVAAVRPRAVPDPERVWSRLRDQLELPRASVVERVLRRSGLAPHDARLVAQAPMFRTEWMSAVLAVLVFATLAAQLGHSRGIWFFLAVAPLVPQAAVALCFDPRIEPALEQELVTPYSTVRLVLLRTLAVLAGGFPVLLLLGLLIPGNAPYLWLVPAAGFVAAVLALSTWTTPLRAAAAIAAVWLVLVSVTAVAGSVHDVLRPPFAFGYAILAAAGVVVFVRRSGHLRDSRKDGGRS
jgi:Putative zinc-finger